jgi:hypothetical protein
MQADIYGTEEAQAPKQKDQKTGRNEQTVDKVLQANRNVHLQPKVAQNNVPSSSVEIVLRRLDSWSIYSLVLGSVVVDFACYESNL